MASMLELRLTSGGSLSVGLFVNRPPPPLPERPPKRLPPLVAGFWSNKLFGLSAPLVASPPVDGLVSSGFFSAPNKGFDAFTAASRASAFLTSSNGSTLS